MEGFCLDLNPLWDACVGNPRLPLWNPCRPYQAEVNAEQIRDDRARIYEIILPNYDGRDAIITQTDPA